MYFNHPALRPQVLSLRRGDSISPPLIPTVIMNILAHVPSFTPYDKCSPSAHRDDNSHQEGSDGSEEWESDTCGCVVQYAKYQGRKRRMAADAQFIDA
jgi:hypothetical protein